MADGFVGILNEALVEEEGPGVAAMNRGGLTAAFEHGSNAAEVEHRFGALEKLAPGAEGDQEPGAVGGATARERGEERVIGMLREGEGDLAIVAGDGSVDRAQSQNERLHGNDGTFNQSRIFCQRHGLGNEGETFLNHIAAAGIMRVVKASNGFRASFLELLEGGPLLQQSAGHGRGQILTAELQRLWEITLEQSLELIGKPGAHIHTATASLG